MGSTNPTNPIFRGASSVGETILKNYMETSLKGWCIPSCRENALHGIQAKSSCDREARVRSTPHPSLKEYLEEAASQLWKDASKGRALITEDDGTDLLAGVVSVPMARVPKMMPDRTLSTKGRVIWDATAVNRTCSSLLFLVAVGGYFYFFVSGGDGKKNRKNELPPFFLCPFW